MPLTTTRPPNARLALILGAVGSGYGWGHFYLGFWGRGLAIALAFQLIPAVFTLILAWLGPGFVPPYAPWCLPLAVTLFRALAFADAWRLALTSKTQSRLETLPFGLALAVCLLILDRTNHPIDAARARLYRWARLPEMHLMRGGDMRPAVDYYERFLVDVQRRPALTDVVAYQSHARRHSEENPVVARVLGLPGDRVAVRRGQLYRNEKRLPEPWVSSVVNRDMPVIDVGPRQVLCLKDERWSYSYWEYWELVDEKSILGVVSLIVDSHDAQGIGQEPPNGPGVHFPAQCPDNE